MTLVDLLRSALVFCVRGVFRISDKRLPRSTPELIFLRKKRCEVGPEDDYSNDRCPNSRHQDGTSGDILGAADQRMKLVGRSVSEQLDGGVHRFGGPNGSHGQDNQAPFRSGEVKVKTSGYHENCRHGMDPRIMLRLQDMKIPREANRKLLARPSNRNGRFIHVEARALSLQATLNGSPALVKYELKIH